MELSMKTERMKECHVIPIKTIVLIIHLNTNILLFNKNTLTTLKL